MRAFTRSATSRLFSPASIMVVPMTVSWPLSVAAPVRNFVPMFTSATSLTSSGFTPAPNLSGRLAMSSALLHAADGADGELLAAAADDAAAGVLDVLRDELGQFAERHAHVCQRVGLGLDDELLFVAAALVDFGDARHGAQQRLDDVFLDFAQLHQLLQLGRRLVRRVGAILDVVVKNLAQAGADGRELGQAPGGKLFQHTLQPLGDELARAVNVRAVLE